VRLRFQQLLGLFFKLCGFSREWLFLVGWHYRIFFQKAFIFFLYIYL